MDGASFLDRSQVQQLVAKRLKVLDFIEKRLQEPKFTRQRYLPPEIGQLMERIQDARAKYLAVGRTQ